MGANAQTTVPTFTAGQVLTAAQMNASARTGVPVFSSTVTRDAAFDGSGEKTLAEGQMCYVEGTGFQTYNGTSWVTWGTAPSGGLDFISSTTIGSAVSSVTVSNAFSSTYDNYKIIVSGGAASGNSYLKLTLGSTVTGYYFAGFYTAASWAGGVTGYGAANAAALDAGGATTLGLQSNIDVFAPNLAARTTFQFAYSDIRTAGSWSSYGGFLNDATQYTAFTLTINAGTMTGGTVKVYGYKN